MAVVTRTGSELPCVKLKYCSGYGPGTSVSNVMTLKTFWSALQVQLCTLALAGSLFNVIRLPRESFKYGPIPYLLAFTICSVAIAMPVALLELALGQFTQQDAVGVWRAVPILRGVGYLKLLTSSLCCVYYMVPLALAAAYIVWIGKGTIPLKDCTKLQMTPVGYENRMNATECFNATFLSPFSAYPQYLGVMAIIIFLFWFFIPIILYRLHKSMKVCFVVCGPLVFILALVLGIAVGDISWLALMQPKLEEWREMLQPHIWLGAIVQALMSAQIKSGYLISSGGWTYYKSDVRWTAATITFENIVAGWIWVLLWVGTGGAGVKDTSFVGVLVVIYQSAVNEKQAKQWPILAYSIVFVSGIMTTVTLLYPIFDRLQRIAGDRWRLIACVGSALGTAMTVAILSRKQTIFLAIDEYAVPFLVVFSTILEVIAFAFIYGWNSLLIDIKFLIGRRLRCLWVVSWWTIPFILIAVTGWWLRAVLQDTWQQPNVSLWPLLGIFIASLAIITIFAAIAVAKEEQYNLFSKIISAFRPSRMWGPEDPMSRYHWMSQKHSDYPISDQDDTDSVIYPQPITNTKNSFTSNWMNEEYSYPHSYLSNPSFEQDYNEHIENVESIYQNFNIPKLNNDVKTSKSNGILRPSVPTLSELVDHEENCKCKRHFSLRVPHYVNGEITTIL